MSNICIYIEVEPYLAQWFVNEQGGELPVRLLRGSLESKLLELYLQHQPPDAKPDKGNGKLAIAIPTFRNRPPEVFNFLPERATRALLNIIRNRFDVQLYTDLHHFGNIGKRQDELIYAWMNAIISRLPRPTGTPLPNAISVYAMSISVAIVQKFSMTAKNLLDFSGLKNKFYAFYDEIINSDTSGRQGHRLA